MIMLEKNNESSAPSPSPEITMENITDREFQRPPTTDSYIGERCGENDRYQIVKLLGKGGMGKVYLAVTETPEGQDQLVAIKFLNKECLNADNKEEIKQRFNREIGFLIELNHPHIVRFLDKGIYSVTHEGETYLIPFYVMEYLQGKTLTQYLIEKEKISFEEALPLMIQVLGALRQTHKRGIIHRDLKPDNIFLVPTFNNKNIVKILDFGIARNLNTMSMVRLTNIADYFGSPYYISPEHIKGVFELDTRTDIYTLGLIFYEMLSGEKPFENYEDMLLTKGWLGIHNNKTPKPLITRQGCENIPILVNDIIMKCLEKNPDHRYQEAEDLLADLITLNPTTSPVSSPESVSSTVIVNSPVNSIPEEVIISSNKNNIYWLILTFILGAITGFLISFIIQWMSSVEPSPSDNTKMPFWFEFSSHTK